MATARAAMCVDLQIDDDHAGGMADQPEVTDRVQQLIARARARRAETAATRAAFAARRAAGLRRRHAVKLSRVRG